MKFNAPTEVSPPNEEIAAKLLVALEQRDQLQLLVQDMLHVVADPKMFKPTKLGKSRTRLWERMYQDINDIQWECGEVFKF